MYRTAIVAVVGLPLALAPAAAAQTVDGRVGFRDDHAANNTPLGDTYYISQTGTYDFQILFGLFDAQGFTHRGMVNFIGDIALTDPNGTATMAPRSGGARRSPYDGYGISYGDGSAGNSTTFDAFRGFNPVSPPFEGDLYVRVPWAYGDPMPSASSVYYSESYDPLVPGSGNGLDEYFPGYRFTVTVPDLVSRTITVDLSGFSQAVSVFYPIESLSPTPTSDGWVTFVPVGFVTDNDIQATLTIEVLAPLPAPGSAALLGLGLAFVHRRRRSA